MVNDSIERTYMKLPEPDRVITDDQARSFHSHNVYQFVFQTVDEPIPGGGGDDLDSIPPGDDELDALADEFAAPQEWYDE